LGQGVIEVELANNTSSSTMPALGITNEELTNSGSGEVVTAGRVANIATNTFLINASLYVGAGILTDVKPTGTAQIQKVANVLRSNASNGVIEVVGAGRSNDVPNFSAVSKFWASDSGAATADEKTITDFALSVLDDADAAAARETLGALSKNAVLSAKTVAYELVAGDNGTAVRCSGTFTVTLPDGLDSGFQATIANIGSGTITLVADTTLNAAGTTLPNQWTACIVLNVGSDVWEAYGALE
jgi:hypothetical protein